MTKALKRWRDARAAMSKAKTYENAVELQVATRNLNAQRHKSLKVIRGGKT
jgi:hypothetical protein